MLKHLKVNSEGEISCKNKNLSGHLEIPSKINGITVTEIGGMAFFGCFNLKSVVIPDSVTKIGRFTFSNCTNLESVVIP